LEFLFHYRVIMKQFILTLRQYDANMTLQ
jgi:hypothetical protein